MTAKVESTFHAYIDHTFRGLKEGRNFRKAPSCGCECGYPLLHSKWSAPAGYDIRVDWACYSDIPDNYLEIWLERNGEEAK